MHISTPDAGDAFLLPQFGGVVLLNPPKEASQGAWHLDLAALEGSFHLFTQHLYSLLALPTYPDKLHPAPPASPQIEPSRLIPPFGKWGLHAFMRSRTKENSEEARKTLAGIVRLVSKIKEMKLGPGVRDKVLGAVERLERVCRDYKLRC